MDNGRPFGISHVRCERESRLDEDEECLLELECLSLLDDLDEDLEEL